MSEKFYQNDSGAIVGFDYEPVDEKGKKIPASKLGKKVTENDFKKLQDEQPTLKKN